MVGSWPGCNWVEDPCWQCSHTLWNVKGCVKGDGSTHLCPVWYRVVLQHKQGPAKHPTKSLLSSFVLSFPPIAHSSPSPFYFLLLSTRFKPLWNRLFPDARSKWPISSFLPLPKGQAEEGTHGLPHNYTLQHSLKPYRIYFLTEKPHFASLCLMCWITSLFGPVFFCWFGVWDRHFPGFSNKLVLVLHLH